jgi:hypothetical protein
MKLGDVVADILLPRVAEQIQLRLVHPLNDPVWPHPVQADRRRLEKVGQLLLPLLHGGSQLGALHGQGGFRSQQLEALQLVRRCCVMRKEADGEHTYHTRPA